MQYCLNLPIGGQAAHPRMLAEFAAVAEASGWDGVFLEDYIVYQNRQDVPTYDPWVALAAMALATSRVRLGTMVTPLARRRPWKLAREAVSIDHLSNGRLTLGVGVGDPEDLTFPGFGESTDIRVRAQMVDEALEVLAGLWTGEPFSYEGRHLRVREVTCLPRPVQQPRIPVWIGGAFPNPGPMRRAARWDGACLYKAVQLGSAKDSEESLTPQEIRQLRSFVERHRDSSTPFDIVAGGPERRPDSDPERERERIGKLAEAGATWFSEWIPPGDPATMRACITRGPLRIDRS
jgi:alkanesulfonate monooxygenase SsuD/methylene tetrahydromethanopterin reductase-like flavin-dependent oxidoreductase (luciferase family)